MDNRVLAAVTKTLYMYEALIEEPRAEAKKWVTRDGGCRICQAMEIYNNWECDGCPIVDKGLTCCGASMSNDGDKWKVSNACIDMDTKNIKRYAKARYKELLRRLKLNGYEYK